MAYGRYARVAAKGLPARSPVSLPARAFPAPTKPLEAGDPAERLKSAERFGHRLENLRVRRRDEAPEGGGGQPLPGIVRAEMEQTLREDFSQVRIHQNGKPASLGADAVAEGESLHFTPGRFAPWSVEGRRLIGHELKHVAQQRAGRVAAPRGTTSRVNADASLETEAEAAGDLVASPSPLRGPMPLPRPSIPQPAGLSAGSAAGGPVLQCGRSKKPAKKKMTRSRKRKEEMMFGSDPNRLIVLGPRNRRGVARYGAGDGTDYGVGSYAASSGIPTRDVQRRFSPKDRQKIAQLGRSSGCHKCGTKTGPFVPDHQPPLSIHRLQHGTLANYKGNLMPHCRGCSSKQGGALARKLRKG